MKKNRGRRRNRTDIVRGFMRITRQKVDKIFELAAAFAKERIKLGDLREHVRRYWRKTKIPAYVSRYILHHEPALA